MYHPHNLCDEKLVSCAATQCLIFLHYYSFTSSGICWRRGHTPPTLLSPKEKPLLLFICGHSIPPIYICFEQAGQRACSKIFIYQRTCRSAMDDDNNSTGMRWEVLFPPFFLNKKAKACSTMTSEADKFLPSSSWPLLLISFPIQLVCIDPQAPVIKKGHHSPLPLPFC